MAMTEAASNPSPWQRALASLLRVALMLGAAVLMIGVLLLGLLLASGAVLWALLRGRRPAAPDLRWGTMPRPGRFGWPRPGEVIDVQVRELDPPTPR